MITSSSYPNERDTILQIHDLFISKSTKLDVSSESSLFISNIPIMRVRLQEETDIVVLLLFSFKFTSECDN